MLTPGRLISVSAFSLTLAVTAAQSQNSTEAQKINVPDQQIEFGIFRGDITTYADHCAEVIGEPIPAFSCTGDGLEIPIRVNGRISGSLDPASCDRPAQLVETGKHACRAGSTVGQLDFKDPDIAAAFICRKIEQGGDEFDEIAIIQHNRQNGATCWFRALSSSGPFRTIGNHSDPDLPTFRLSDEVQSPMQSRFVNQQTGARTDNAIEWEGVENELCQTCHIPDPFLHTPYLRQPELMVDGKSIVPSLFTPPGPYDIRLWNPLNPFSDVVGRTKIVFNPNSKGAVCTACHLLTPGNPAEGGALIAVQTFVTPAGGGEPDFPIGAEVRVNPDHGWMHAGPPGPFQLAKPSAATNAALRDVLNCMKAEQPGICHYEKILGRPALDLVITDPTPLDGAALAHGASVPLIGRPRNHDLGDRIRWTIADARGVTTLPRDTAFDQSTTFSPDCAVGEQVTVSAMLVSAAGDVKQPIVLKQRKYQCAAPSLTRWDDVHKTLSAMPETRMTGTLPSRVVGKQRANLRIGDDRRNRQARAFLGFTIRTSDVVGIPKSATLRFLMMLGDGAVAANFGDVRVHRYDFGPALERRDYDVSGHFAEGLATFAPRSGVIEVDVTAHVVSAWRDGRDTAEMGIWLRRTSDDDGAPDEMLIENAPRQDGVGGIDFDTTLQPVLTVVFE